MELKEDIKDYWNLRSCGFSGSVMEEYNTRGKEILDRIMEDTGVEVGSKVLDLGCGPGLFSLLLDSAGMDVIGVDYSDGMIDKAVSNAKDKASSAKFMRMDAQALDFENNSFDLVVSRDLFWNLERPEKAYREILRVLKPKGKAFILDGNYYLYLYDEGYLRDRKDRSPEGGTSRETHNTDGVDFKIMENIARDLPMSRVKRPQWDVDKLCCMGCSVIDIRILRADRSEENRHVFRFEIVFTKEG